MKMKRILSLLLAVSMLFSLSVMGFSVDSEEIVRDVNGVTFVFEPGTSEEIQERLIDIYFNGDNPEPKTRGLLCTLFGHNITTTQHTGYSHYKYADAPHCEAHVYSVELCSRCDYSHSTLIRTYRVSCH